MVWKNGIKKIVCFFAFIGFLVVLVGCSNASSVGTQGTTPTVSSAPHMLGSISGPFTATILEGLEKNASLTGTLNLQLSSNGSLSGTLATTTAGLVPQGQSIPVMGQVNGQLIGLYFSLGSGKGLSGSGVIGYDATSKANVIGGTFSGPDESSSGTWDYHSPLESTGGCLEGIPYIDSRPGVGAGCYTIPSRN